MFQAIQSHALTIYQAPLFAGQSGIVHGFSSRAGGFSKAPYTGLNLGLTSGDDIETVRKIALLMQRHWAYCLNRWRQGIRCMVHRLPA